MEFHTWLLYLLTELVLSLTPGPAVLLICSQGLKYGARYSYAGAFGISTGNIMYFILSSLGLATLIMTAGNLFEYLKIGGALYLVITGLMLLRNASSSKYQSVSATETTPPYFKTFLQGFVTQAANPKAILFFVALLPQFINPQGNIGLQFFILTVSTVVLETLILMLYGWLSSKGKDRLSGNQVFRKWQDRIAGSVLIGLGINLFFVKRE